MDIEITGKEQKPLLRRTEMKGRIAFQGATPTKKQVVEAVAKATGAKHDLIIVRRIKTDFGSQSAQILARVYEDKKSLETLELKATLRKHGMLAEEKKEDKKEEKIQEEQQEDKKVQEEKKAEKKAEAKEEKKEQAGPQPHKATKKEKGAEPAPPKTGGDE